MAKIKALVERIIYHNPDNGYHALKILINEVEEATATVYQLKVHEGFTMDFEGEWKKHSKYGLQFEAKKAFEAIPVTSTGLKAYLSSSFFPGIGPVIANRIIKYFGEDAINIFNKDISQLMHVPGIAEKKLIMLKEGWEKNKAINEIMLFLQQYNISTLFATRILETYGINCIQIIRENPYRLCNDIERIGFAYADRVALELGFDKECPERIKAGIQHILSNETNFGHCYMLEGQIEKSVSELLKIDSVQKIDEVLHEMESQREIKLLIEKEEKRYYSNRIYYNEQYCAFKIKQLKVAFSEFEKQTVDKWKERSKNSESIQLSNEQVDSVVNIILNGVSILTGGPGTGKTTITKSLVDLLVLLNRKIELAAPTGRAAKRMSEVIGFQAHTIHRLLVWNPILGGFIHNEKNPLDCDFLIIDESSMIDINLAASLLKAIPSGCQVLFVGDYNQLPPVGPGSFFKDIIESEVIPVFKLTKIFRQSESSDIIKYAHKINNGEIPEVESPIANPKLWEGTSDCLFIDSGVYDESKNKGEYPQSNSLRYGMDVNEMIKKIYFETIPKYFGKDKEVQILSPINVGDYGTKSINKLIQLLVNPPEKDKNELRLGERIFREGDKVIHKVNNYELGVFNGEIGYVTKVSNLGFKCNVAYDDGDRVIEYKKDDLLDLDLAYGISIHKSQGSEFDCVIIPILNQHYRMLYRNLVYTGMTRGKKLVVFIGHRQAFVKSIENSDSSKRQTSLKEMLLKDNEFVLSL